MNPSDFNTSPQKKQSYENTFDPLKEFAYYKSMTTTANRFDRRFLATALLRCLWWPPTGFNQIRDDPIGYVSSTVSFESIECVFFNEPFENWPKLLWKGFLRFKASLTFFGNHASFLVLL